MKTYGTKKLSKQIKGFVKPTKTYKDLQQITYLDLSGLEAY